MQLGRCAYTGKSISFDELDDNSKWNIDHIWSQAKIKDDSLENKVLVNSNVNGAKSDRYPIDKGIRDKMCGFWHSLREKGLMSEKKYSRLIRSTPFTEEELSGFIARQLVETRQSTKAVATILKEIFPESEIVYVKASIVSEFRQEMGMLKCREINDLHHAKDAYLNIVLGNVYNTKLTKNPLNFIRGSHDTSAKLRKQIKWDDDLKAYIWSEIIAEKIRKQAEFLEELGKHDEASLLKKYIEELELGDVTNREGHAAKVYFNAIFGKEFTRSQECVTNAALNYGYSIILPYFNREITSHGYVTQLGLFHSNMFNHFNFSCDLMEPFRVIVDRCVADNGFTKFDKDEKHILVDLLNSTVYINGMEQYLGNAIKLYCRSVFDALNDNDVSQITFYSLKKQG